MARGAKYELETAAFFTALGRHVEVRKDVRGARAVHNVDVFVAFHENGIPQRWIVECKEWNKRVDKEKVLALQRVVEDVGANLGLLLCEQGFQAGAIGAAAHSNVLLTSLSKLRAVADADVRRRLTLFAGERLVVDLLGPASTRTFAALIDSGAALNVVPLMLAEPLGIPLDETETRIRLTRAGETRAHVAEIGFSLRYGAAPAFEWRAPAEFHPDAHIVTLGRHGLFDLCEITFVPAIEAPSPRRSA